MIGHHVPLWISLKFGNAQTTCTETIDLQLISLPFKQCEQSMYISVMVFVKTLSMQYPHNEYG